MFWLYYFMLIFCFIGFLTAIAETVAERDGLGMFFRVCQGATFAISGVIISGLI